MRVLRSTGPFVNPAGQRETVLDEFVQHRFFDVGEALDVNALLPTLCLPSRRCSAPTSSPPWGWVLFSLLSATGPSSLSESGSRHGSIGFDARRELGNPHQHFGAEAGCGFDDDAVFIAVHRSHAFIDIAEPDRVARICAAEGTPDLVRLDPDTIVFDRDHALGAGILRDD